MHLNYNLPQHQKGQLSKKTWGYIMSSNFDFLENKYPLLANLGRLAENNLYDDPNTTLFKLRLFSEQIVKTIFSTLRLREPLQSDHNIRLNILRNDGIAPAMIVDIFHTVRKAGNKAVHEATGEEANTILTLSFKIGLWFMSVYGREDVSKLKYIPPVKENKVDKDLKLTQLENEYKLLEEKYKQLSIEKAQQPVEEPVSVQELNQIRNESVNAVNRLNLTEAETRKIIDEKLRQAGWEVDSENLRFDKGTRPKANKNMAIAEWSVGEKWADYALFVGLKFIGIIEAKRQSTDVISVLEQAKIYAKKASDVHNAQLTGQWNDYKVPFIFATNGRPYLKQLETKSGIWFLDARLETNHPRALQSWYSPEGLIELLEKDETAASEKLKAEKFDYLEDKSGLGLRDYQKKAIEKVEQAIEKGKRNVLVAMATGTGKTRTIIGLTYRLVKSGTFKHILFLVDRSLLGTQANDSFKDVVIEDFKTFASIYDIKELKDKKIDSNTKVHFATVQGMVKRLFYSEDNIPAVNTYDCIIVDEAHRGYILDRDLSEDEIIFKNQDDYLGKYRKVLDYFDAVKIGLTATPATHTVEIFGNPVFNYSYREAVIEGHLIDHEPPVIIETELKRNGMLWKTGDVIKGFNRSTGNIEELGPVEDELNIDVSGFNTRVIAPNFNKTVVEELVKYIDPESREKTLIFAATDSHADLVVKQLIEEFENIGVNVHTDAIKKITSNPSVYDPQQLVRMFKNERYPNIVVTVDLLTTGVDVPEICNLVFLRRVRSRILYEQMLGRATRKADHIEKDHFKIFDAVGIYEILKDFTDMKPVVSKPNTDFKTLINELSSIDSIDEISEEKKEELKRKQIDEIIAKLQRKKKKITKENMELFQGKAEGKTPEEFIKWIKELPSKQATEQIKNKGHLFMFLDEIKGDGWYQIISEHDDKILEVSRGYGHGKKPEDYIESFKNFIQNNLNEIPALMVVCQRPKELTRQSLKELKYELDKAGYSETSLNTAWRELKNEDIAADIISFIRQQALGDALISHQDRIKNAIRKVKRLKQWTAVQEKWLDRIEKQLLIENIIDRDSFDRDPFKTHGGFEQINKVFNKDLENVISMINENLYVA